MTTRRPGYGLYRGIEYRMRSRGASSPRSAWWAVEVEGEIMSTWCPTIADAVADFKAGLDDVLAGDAGADTRPG